MVERRRVSESWLKVNFLGLLVILGTVLVSAAHIIEWEAKVTIDIQEIKRRLSSVECTIKSGCYQGGAYILPQLKVPDGILLEN